MHPNKFLNIKGQNIALVSRNNAEFISLTDMANSFGDEVLIYSWMRNRNTLEFIGIWEELHNTNFKGHEFVTFKNQAGLNNFNLTPKKWIKVTNAIGIISKSGRYGGGTFAHQDIAFEFASWLSPEFKLYLIKEFQRLKEDENRNKSIDWDIKRTLSKINYRLHTDAIKEYLIPNRLIKEQINIIYANEADVLNKSLFGLTAKEWRDQNPTLEGNIRNYSDVTQLVCLFNLESLNAEFIRQQISQTERLLRLNEIAIIQMRSLIRNSSINKLK